MLKVLSSIINSLLGEIVLLTLVGFWTVIIWKKEWDAVSAAWKSKAMTALLPACLKLAGDIFLTKTIVATFGIGGSKAAVAFGLILSNLVSYAFFVPRKQRSSS